MPQITFDNQSYECFENETVLDCLTRHNCPPPSSCRSGICHTCMMRAVAGIPPKSSQNGLKPGLISQQYFLACSCIPTEDLTVTLAGSDVLPHFQAKLIEKSMLSPSIVRLRFQSGEKIAYQAGQYLNLFRDSELSRTFSIASIPSLEDYLEFHIEVLEDGKFSQWVKHALSVGTTIQISEALGECVYYPANNQKNMLMIATGTGLAPLYGVVRDALHQNHEGKIFLYHGASSPDKLYLVDEIRALAAQHKNLVYFPCLSRNQIDGFYHGRANEIAINDHKNLKDWCVYLCGHPDMVKSTKQKVFLAGASLSNIYSDSFEYATQR